MKTVTINGTEYGVRKTLRAIFIFELIKKDSFEIKTLLDNFLFFYSVLLACNPDNPIGWNDFIDAMDKDKTLCQQINDILQEGEEAERMLEGDKTEETEETGGEKKN